MTENAPILVHLRHAQECLGNAVELLVSDCEIGSSASAGARLLHVIRELQLIEGDMAGNPAHTYVPQGEREAV